MALRLTRSSAQYAQRTSDLLSPNAAYTVAGWVYIQSLPGDACHIWTFQNVFGAFQDMDCVAYTSAGKFRIENYSGGSGGSTTHSGTISTGVWYHVALVRSSLTSLKCYIDGVEEMSLTNDMTGRTFSLAPVNTLGAYDSSNQYSHDGRLWGWKAWEAALTEAEIRREMRQALPVRVSNLYEAWPLLRGANRAKGYYKGRDLTEANSPTDEDPPSVAWSSPRTLVVLPAAGGSNTTVTPGVASLSLTAYTPSVTTPVTCTPGVASLSLTAYAVTLGEVVTPGVASLATTTYAPTVTAPVTCTPGVASLSLTAYTPSVGQPTEVTPGTASLALSLFTPTVSTPVTCTPGVASLSLTAYAPTIPTSETLVPGVAALTLTPFVPDVGYPVTVTPGTAALTLTRYEPAVAVPDGVTVGYLMRVTQDGTAVASTASRVSLSTAHEVTMHVNCIVTVASSGTVKIQVLADDVSDTRTLLDNASQGDTATIISAIKVMD